jgi:hypothetical protein
MKAASHLLVSYGPAKMGKTLDLGLTFCTPASFFFTPSPSTLTPLNGMAGFVPPKVAQVSDFESILKWLRAHRDDDKCSGVVIDDIALIGDRAMDKHTKALGTSYDRWNKLNDELRELFELSTTAPYYVAVTSHEVGPAEFKDTWVPGGPKLPSKPAGDTMSKNAGCILRAIVKADSPAADAWPVIYSCDRSDPNYVIGDRNGFALPDSPLNMREILHAGGVSLPRLVEGQEDLVEKLSTLIVEGKLTKELLAAAKKKMGDTKSQWWTMRDARARAYMKTHAVDRVSVMEEKLLSAHGAL